MFVPIPKAPVGLGRCDALHGETSKLPPRSELLNGEGHSRKAISIVDEGWGERGWSAKGRKRRKTIAERECTGLVSQPQPMSDGPGRQSITYVSSFSLIGAREVGAVT
jgi:hypothetical protein